MDRTDVIKNHVDLYLEFLRHDGDGPIMFDTVHGDWRVIRVTVNNMLGRDAGRVHEEPDEYTVLHPVYNSQPHGKSAIDSNLLVLLSMFHCSPCDMGLYFIGQNMVKVKQMVRYYDRFMVDGIISQPAHSDWQTSQRREYPTFLMNLLYHEVTKRLDACGVLSDISPGFSTAKFASRIERAFYDPASGLYRNTLRGTAVSLEGNLFALQWRFPRATVEMWSALQKHPLWGGVNGVGIPGFVAYPDYPQDDTALRVLMSGLRHYHDSFYWSWLMAFSAEVAASMGCHVEAGRILGKMAALVDRDCTIQEVWCPADGELQPFRSFMYRSETGFSWGAAYVITALRRWRGVEV